MRATRESAGTLRSVGHGGTRFRPKVFAAGRYTIEVGEGAGKKTLRGVESVGVDSDATLDVVF